MIVNWIVSSPCVFFFVAAASSIFYGVNCWTINELDQNPNNLQWSEGTLPWKLHQIWLNFLGSALGWWALWVLFLDYSRYREAPNHPLTYVDLVLVIVAFLGVTGYLPHVSRYGSDLYPGKK